MGSRVQRAGVDGRFGRARPRDARSQGGTVTVREALRDAHATLAIAGCGTPRLDAEVLLAHALGVRRERVALDGGLTLAAPVKRAFQQLLRRRAVEREPVAYIVGRRSFRRLELDVDARALVPRPETELLVEVALTLDPGARVLDLGTGSGAVALALKDERGDLQVSGSDISSLALELAAANGRRLGLDISWLRADLLRGVPDEFDALVANLPYVAERERVGLAPEISRHEPLTALMAGPDGLASIRALLAQVPAHRRVQMLALEVGAGQAPGVARMMTDAGFGSVRAERDLAGVERVVVGERVRA
ncbi:MAG: peptide chain release factor N(5)-glutamine methyltransferase [Actinobacteria bacterium]|nr:MAG: peptide chain release factor N(5)-glutamine methyltransferase [Actinomycetota bacterium]